MAGGGGTGRALLSLSHSLSSSSSLLFSRSILFSVKRPISFPLSHCFHRTLCLSATAVDTDQSVQPLRHAILLDRIRSRQLKDSPTSITSPAVVRHGGEGGKKGKEESKGIGAKKVETFEELGLSEEVLGAVKEMGISAPTEIQSIGVPAVLDGKSVVLGSHTGSGKTLAYLLPLVQLLRRDEASSGRHMKPRRPRAVVLCPTRELCEQVFRVSKSISHHARFRSTMISGGSRLRPQEDSLNMPIDMVVGTPGRLLQHIEEGNMVYGDIKYLVLDEADTMFDRGFGPEIRKFLGPLRARALKADGERFQTVLVTATMTKAVQMLVDEEFQGITHIRTSSLHKKVASARHDFIKLSGAENKLEALLQVLEPSLARGNRIMVFCNTLNSSRAVDHYLTENQISTVNYHGEVPAEQRVENLKKFKSDDGDCPTLVCTDLAARGLDLDVDHVIMFDFPLNSIDYLHRTGRTARMGAKGKVTSLVAKKDALLASRIEESLRKNESLESLNAGNVRRDAANSQRTDKGEKSSNKLKVTDPRNKARPTSSRPTAAGRRLGTPVSTRSAGRRVGTPVPTRKTPTVRTGKPSLATKSGKPSPTPSKVANGSKVESSKGNRGLGSRKKTPSARSAPSKLSVVGFRGRSSSNKESPRHG